MSGDSLKIQIPEPHPRPTEFVEFQTRKRGPPSTPGFFTHIKLETPTACKAEGLGRQPGLALYPDLSLPSCMTCGK